MLYTYLPTYIHVHKHYNVLYGCAYNIHSRELSVGVRVRLISLYMNNCNLFTIDYCYYCSMRAAYLRASARARVFVCWSVCDRTVRKTILRFVKTYISFTTVSRV